MFSAKKKNPHIWLGIGVVVQDTPAYWFFTPVFCHRNIIVVVLKLNLNVLQSLNAQHALPFKH